MIAVLRRPEHVFEAANPRYLRLVGEGRTIVGRSVREALPELEGQGLIELLDEVFTSGNPFVGLEVPVQLDRLGDGTLDEAFFNFSYQPLFASEGEVDGILVHAVEVTEQVRARQVVEEQAAELQQQAAELEQQVEEIQALAEELELANDELQSARETAEASRHMAEQRAEELSRRAREAALMGDIGRALTRGGPLREMLCRCTDAVVEHLDAAFARIWTLEESRCRARAPGQLGPVHAHRRRSQPRSRRGAEDRQDRLGAEAAPHERRSERPAGE